MGSGFYLSLVLVPFLACCIIILTVRPGIRAQEVAKRHRAARIAALPPPLRDQVQRDDRRATIVGFGMIAAIIAGALLLPLSPALRAWANGKPTLVPFLLLLMGVTLPFMVAALVAAILGRVHRGATILDLGRDEQVEAWNRHWYMMVPLALFLGIKGVELIAGGQLVWGALALLWTGTMLGQPMVRSSGIGLTDRGLVAAGWLHPWTRVEQCHLAADLLCIALKFPRWWPLRRWWVIPVPSARAQAAREILWQALPAGAVATSQLEPAGSIDRRA